jgi:Arc/MetJ-type ribon-helix-helix transcriptional regulator
MPVQVELDPLVADQIQRKVDAGLYPDATAVVPEAMRLLEAHDQIRVVRAMLAEADAQIDRGDYVEWLPDLMEELSREADEMAQQGIKPHPDVLP